MKPSETATVVGITNAVGNKSAPQPYDELVIWWNDLPRDTKATLFFPEWDADEIIAAASSRQLLPFLKKVDAHTLECAVTDISYIPVPRFATPYAGLITLQLPQTVTSGQVFRVDVQQHSGAYEEVNVALPRGGVSGAAKTRPVFASARKILGAFRLTIPVSTEVPVLSTAIRNLAVLRYIAQGIPTSDHWYPIFERYIGQIAAKVKGLGGDPGLVVASPDDPGILNGGNNHPGHCVCPDGRLYFGKVTQVIYDCFGDFQGFILESCSTHRHFESNEKGICKVALHACEKGLYVSVRVPDRPDAGAS